MYLVICAATVPAALWAAIARRSRVVVGLAIGVVWVLLVASGLLLPILGRFMPVPRLAATLVARAAPDDAVIVYATGIHSLMYYADRPTSVARNPAQLLELVPEGRRAFLLGSEDALRELRALPNWSILDVDRAPYFKFRFNWNIRGAGRSTRDLELIELRRRSPGPPGEAAPGAVRSAGDR